MTSTSRLGAAAIAGFAFAMPFAVLAQDTETLSPEAQDVVEACGDNAENCEEESRELLRETGVANENSGSDAGIDLENTGELDATGDTSGTSSGNVGGAATSSETLQGTDLNGRTGESSSGNANIETETNQPIDTDELPEIESGEVPGADGSAGTTSEE